ncbi:MAG: hypothetical protein OXC57_12445 [Rhodobacteraceae bacterium]|nr:hypothetical protein [Paracoccaceae bacterium]
MDDSGEGPRFGHPSTGNDGSYIRDMDGAISRTIIRTVPAKATIFNETIRLNKALHWLAFLPKLQLHCRSAE